MQVLEVLRIYPNCTSVNVFRQFIHLPEIAAIVEWERLGLLARRRFFVESVRGDVAELHGEEAHHLTRVLRVQPGQQYEVSDNRSVYLAEIVDARPGHVLFRILQAIDSPSLPLRLTLCVALIKFDRFEWMVEKATELGVERIVPVESARSEKGLAEAARKRRQRWSRIAHEAGQQSRRVMVPEILEPIALDACFEQAADYRYFLDEVESAPLRQLFPAERTPSDRVSLLCGPEGGWTDAERTGAVARGWQRAYLGPTILRAETAAIAATAVSIHAWTR